MAITTELVPTKPAPDDAVEPHVHVCRICGCEWRQPGEEPSSFERAVKIAEAQMPHEHGDHHS